MSPLLPLSRSGSRASLAPSDTTYHSFRDIELEEPSLTCGPPPGVEKLPPSYEMRRQDSGYESLTPRDSQTYRRRASSASGSSSHKQRPRPRPSIQRTGNSGPIAHVPRNGARQVNPTRSHPAYQLRETGSYFHFPPPEHSHGGREPAKGPLTTSVHDTNPLYPNPSPSPCSETPTYSLPPQTTHYWTSDRTRRLEYAAIDAASQGVRGWVMRYMVPDCFIPKDHRRVRFEDDRGSVVRYRLELEGEDSAEKAELEGRSRRKGWRFSTRSGR